jgi:ferredoxin
MTPADQDDWATALDELAPHIHPVDRVATRIWFRFFPLQLADAVAGTTDRAALERRLRLEGRYDLADQVDSSHWFLYGHRYWHAVTSQMASAGPDAAPASLAAAIRHLASQAADAVRADVSLLLGISAAAMMTRQQVGAAACNRPAGLASGTLPPQSSPDEPDEIVSRRQRDDAQGVFGVFRGQRRRYSVWFDERRPDGRFPIVNQQHVTTAGAVDTRAYEYDRGYSQSGPIPAQCRSGSCGTCWVGVLGGAEKLSEVERLEARRLKECGYLDDAAGTPFIRLACMARAAGNVTIVIPPWNGFIGNGRR